MNIIETKSGWPLALRYGLILAFANIAINLLFYIVNPNPYNSEFSVYSISQLALTIVAGFTILSMAAKMRRDNDLGGVMSYGESLKIMMQTALPAALIISFYTYLFFTFISPEFFTKMWEIQAEQMSQKGMSDEEIEQALRIGSKFNNPLIMTIFGALGVLFQLFIFSLIASIFVKKEPKDTDF